MAPNYARAERLALCDLLTDLGPDQPTLCAGWTTRDLAAHLVARERRPLAAPGLILRPLAGYTERVRQSVARRPFPVLV
ncbi:MAG: maleylpyruvate isomerase family mycothiol-dependent enzyme, partial [Natronosporangium sp.]